MLEFHQLGSHPLANTELNQNFVQESPKRHQHKASAFSSKLSHYSKELVNRLLPTFLITITYSLCHQAQAEDIQWFNSFFSDSRDSHGLALTSEWEFQLGYFVDGFVPTNTNSNQWSEKWVALDATIYDEFTERFFSNYANDASALGENAYIWGLNRQLPQNEWLLIGDDSWIVPFAGGILPPKNWSAANASIVIAGSVDAIGSVQTENKLGEPPVLDFEHWELIHFTESEVSTGKSNAEADPDGDGLSNGVEFALASDPMANGDSPIIKQVMGPNGQPTITLPLACHANATVILEVSENLNNWRAGEPDITILDSSPTHIVFQNNSTTARSFARIGVIIP